MQDDISDLLQDAEEIQMALGRSYGLPDDIDEDELDAGTSFICLRENECAHNGCSCLMFRIGGLGR